MSTARTAPPPTRPQAPRTTAAGWMKANLFSSPFNAALTVVLGVVLGLATYRLLAFALVDARWEIVEKNVVNLLVFRFPRDELWRLWVALFVLAFSLGLGAAVLARLRRLRATTEEPADVSRLDALRRAAPLLAVVAVFLWFGSSLTATILVAGIVATWAAARSVARLVPDSLLLRAGVLPLLGLVAAYGVVVAFGGVGWDRWGGLLLTVSLAIGGIVLSFPLGVLLALGRRSDLPAVRIVCIGYIELIRGVPLITILFMGAFMLGFFMPPGVDTPSLEARALVALVIFTSAYVAEIVRGGLQSVPRGQREAAQALGLSPPRVTLWIVLPQALRAVIPALVGQFISLFKDTSLVAIIGLTEILAVSETITKQPQFLAQGLIIETLVFAGFVYWAGSYWMSRESQRLEQRLEVSDR